MLSSRVYMIRSQLQISYKRDCKRKLHRFTPSRQVTHLSYIPSSKTR